MFDNIGLYICNAVGIIIILNPGVLFLIILLITGGTVGLRWRIKDKWDEWMNPLGNDKDPFKRPRQ